MDPWTDRLSDYIDGELTGDEHSAIEQHLAACEACRVTVADLRAVAARAATLPPRRPDADLWPAIARRIAGIRPARRVFTFSLPQLAAAAGLLIALSGGLVWLLQRPGPPAGGGPLPDSMASSGGRALDMTLPVSFADESYDKAVSDLQRALEQEREHLDPETVKVIERNLAAIDAAIAQARHALESDPSNTYLNGHLADARRRKLALLRSVSAMADPEG